MKTKEQNRFNQLYQRHLMALKLRGYSDSTIDVYARAVRRLYAYFDICPDRLSTEQLEDYFFNLIDSRSWSTVKVDRNGLQFFWKNILKKDWTWLKIVRPPKIKSLPDILTLTEIEQLLHATDKLRFRIFLLTTYSMGLRLSETLALQVGDIDRHLKQVHIRRGKGHKDRFVPLPDITYQGLRSLWSKHQHPYFLFPKPTGTAQQIKNSTTAMSRSSVQSAMKAVVAQCGIKKKCPSIHSGTALQPTC